MNIKGQGHSLTFVQCHSDSTFSNFFSLETDGLIQAKFHVEPPWDRGMKNCSNGLCHMTNIAAMLLYSKNLKKVFFSRTKRPMTLSVGMQHRVLEYYQVYSNDDPGLALTSFTAMSNLIHYAFVWVKAKTMDFSETILVCDIKVCRQLNEYMNLYEYQRSRSFIDLRPRSLRFNIFKLLFLRNC